MKKWRWDYSSTNDGFYVWYGHEEQKADDKIIEDWFRTYHIAERVCELLNEYEDLRVPYPSNW